MNAPRLSAVAAKLKTLLQTAGMNDALDDAGLPTVPDANWHVGSTLVDLPQAGGALPALGMAWHEPYGGMTREQMGMGGMWYKGRIYISYGLEFWRDNITAQLESAENGVYVIGDLLDENCRDYADGNTVWWKNGFWGKMGAGNFTPAVGQTFQFTAGYLEWGCWMFAGISDEGGATFGS